MTKKLSKVEAYKIGENAAAIPSPFGGGAIVPMGDESFHFALNAAYEQGVMAGFQKGVAYQSVIEAFRFYEWLRERIANTARYAVFNIPAEIIKGDLNAIDPTGHGAIFAITGAFNQFCSEARTKLNMEITEQFPELGEEVQAIVNGLEAVFQKYSPDDRAEQLRQACQKFVPGHEIDVRLRAQYNQGGREPKLEPLYNVAYPLFLKHHTNSMKWRTIRREIEAMLKEPTEGWSPDLAAVATLWDGLDDEQRREQLRTIFRDF